MGVGDYIHSKEAGQPRGPADLGPSQRQLRAEQAKVEVPATRLGEPKNNGRAASPRFQPPVTLPVQSRSSPEHGAQRDMFDTDVEGVDDSTIAGTSVFNFEDGQSQQPSNEKFAQNTSPRPSYLPRPTHPHRSSWYGGLGDQAMKKAGFDSDDAESTASQLTSSVAEDGDDEKSQEPNGWYLSHKHRSVEEPLSKRLENFWSASKRVSSIPTEQVHSETQPSAPVNPMPVPPPRKLGHMLPSTGPRKITIPHSMSATPRTRFSPPKPSLLDRLDISPTRHGSEPLPQTTRPLAMAPLHHTEESDDEEDAPGIDETIRVSSRRTSDHSANVFDMTNLSNLSRDDDEMMQDPFFSRSTAKRGRRNTVIHTRKRHLEADYPPEVLYQKSFNELQAEPFDKAPTPPPPPPAKSPSLPPAVPPASDTQSPENAVAQLLRLTDQDRETHLARMSVDEWEDCGDQLIDRFSHLLTEMKNLRRARRRTAAVFEAEVRRRHEEVELQNSELSTKLEEMRTGGAEVLRGRSP